MITKADLAAVNEFMNAEASVGTNLTPDLAGGASRTSHHAEPGASPSGAHGVTRPTSPAPGAPSGVGNLLKAEGGMKNEETVVLEASAAQSAETAAAFIRTGNRGKGRLWLHRALEQLNEAEIED